MKYSSLYLWLTTFLIKAAKPEKEAEDKKVAEKIAPVYGMEFLEAKAKRYQDKI